MDEAGNVAHSVQYIDLEYMPTLSLLAQSSFSCNSASDSIRVPTNTATAPNPCRLPLQLSYEDSVSVKVCPSEFVRNWTVTVCDITVSQLQNITLFDLCPPYACGRNESAPRGVCSLGECQCNANWYGEDCSTLIHEPVVRQVNNSVLQEAQQYFIGLTLLQGTPPLSWNLITGPRRLEVDQYSGQVSWNRAEAGNHSVSVRVENQVGYTEVTWTLQVQPGYSAKLDQIIPTLYSYAQPIVLTGNVEYVKDNLVKALLAGIVPVSIDIISNGVTRTLETFTTSDGNFSVVFHPAIREYGSYQAGSRHPGISKATPQTSWGILGFKATPNPVHLTGEAVKEFDKTFYNATIVCNDGPAALNGIKIISTFSNSDVLQIGILEKGLPSNNTLEPGGKLTVDIKIVASNPLHGLFAILVTSTERVSIRIGVSFQIEPILPTFLIQPSSVNTRIVKGSSRVFEFNVTNTGRTVANTVRPLLPNTDIISFISFGNGSSLDLSSGESAVLSILVQTPTDQQLGEISISIAIISTQISSNIPIRITVSSDVLMNLTVVVEDEFTYFASGEPLVDNAVITLINYQRNIRISMTTERDNGSATFLNIYEDRYELFIEAPDHLSLHEIIVTSLDNPTLIMFMQRQTVTYTWSVTPVEFQDTYVLTIEADFVTFVPIPVVTVTPSEFDLEELELGFISSIQLNITNHGLIRANDVSIELPPDVHPFLQFSVPSNSTELGYLEPLSSTIVTIQVSHKAIQKRGIVTTVRPVIYLIKILYSYVCGDIRFRSVSVVIKKQITSYNRLECCGCGGGSLGGVFTFRGYSSSTRAFCNKCIQAVLTCFPSLKVPLAGCIPLILSGSTPTKSMIDSLKWIQCITANPVLRAFLCAYELDTLCGETLGFNKRNLDNIVQDLVGPLLAISQSIDAATEALGDVRWLSVGDKDWVTYIVQPALDDNSEAGVLISTTELSIILTAPLPNGTTIEMVTNLIERLNNTLHGWSSGQLEPPKGFNMASFSRIQELTQNISTHNDEAISKGFSSYLDAYNFGSTEFNKIKNFE